MSPQTADAALMFFSCLNLQVGFRSTGCLSFQVVLALLVVLVVLVVLVLGFWFYAACVPLGVCAFKCFLNVFLVYAVSARCWSFGD